MGNIENNSSFLYHNPTWDLGRKPEGVWKTLPYQRTSWDMETATCLSYNIYHNSTLGMGTDVLRGKLVFHRLSLYTGKRNFSRESSYFSYPNSA